MRSLRVLHLVANRWWTGSAEPALDLARALRGRGHDVSFACIRGDLLEAKAVSMGFLPVPELSLERSARPWKLAADLRELRRFARDRRIQIVHTHLSHDHWLATIALHGLPVRRVRTLHHRRAVTRVPGRGSLLRRADALLAASEAIAQTVRRLGVDAGRVTVIPGAVDTTRFSANLDGAAVRGELKLHPGPVVGCVARLVPGRGHDLLLEATRRLRTRFPTLRLLLVGRGEGRPALERLVDELGLTDVVVFAGYRGEDLPQTLAAMDCFVLLGAGSEESCRAVLEAMAAGRAVVATPVGALPETIVDGETGWLVTDSPEVIADRLAAVLGDATKARAMGRAGRRRVEALFTSERRAAAVEQVYARVLAHG